MSVRYFIHLGAFLNLFLAGLLPPVSLSGLGQAVQPPPPAQEAGSLPQSSGGSIYLPVAVSLQQVAGADAVPLVNVPHFEEAINLEESAIFWFGRVQGQENYADIRLAYNSEELFIQLGIFDRYLWYDISPSPQDLEKWDAATLYLDTGGNTGSSLGETAYRFAGQLNWWENRAAFQAAYRGSDTGWLPFSGPFTTATGYRGDSPNNMDADRGWRITYRIPFTSLGLSGPPPEGTKWGIAIRMFDRDDEAGAPILPKTWPGGANLGRPSTWGRLSFGLPQYSPPVLSPAGTTIIRQGLNGGRVIDGQVGGSTTCGRGLEVFTEWGEKNYGGYDKINVQNQSDVADFPCFSKIYIAIPLDQVPAGKVILSAKLTLYQFGNAGGGEWGEGPDSFIQALTVAEDWDKYTLNWNNAPPPVENVSQTWVDWLGPGVDWPGIARTWDVSRATQPAYEAGAPLRLVLYSADLGYHSGKYFSSSDSADWNAEARPALEVVWGNP